MNILDYLRSLWHPQPALPLAVVLLNNFNAVVRQMDTFKAQPNDGAKYVYFTHQMNPRPPQALLGITPAWINALDDEGLLNGAPVSNTAEVPMGGGVFTWVHSLPPGYFEALGPVADSRHALEKYLVDMANASPYLQSLGLTPEAVARAASIHE